MNQKTALIFGATGAVGKQLLTDLLQNGNYAKVVAVGRRNVKLEETISQEKLVQKTIDFENLEAHREDFRNVSDVYCCLGSTSTGRKAEEFIKFDQSYVVNSARIIAEENRVDEGKLAPVHFLYCSSMGSNKDSIFLYGRTKGQTEHALSSLGFEKVSIFKPGFLQPVEPRNPPRIIEKIAFHLYNPIDRLFGIGLVVGVETVGKAMHRVAVAAKKSTQEHTMTCFYSNSEIKQLGL